MKNFRIFFIYLFLSYLTACASSTRQSEPAQVSHAPAPELVASSVPAVSHQSPDSVTSEKALGWLKNGNIRFLKNKLRKDGAGAQDIKRLSKGQHPHTIVLSCSDSRVPPEIVFDQKLGEIFVIRTAGEDIDKTGLASIEYAVEHLGPQLIVVMGHTSCGAVKAAIETADKDAGSSSLNQLVHDIQPRLGDYVSRKPSEDFKDESWAEAQGVARELVEKSEIIKNRVQSGNLKIVSALYHTENGTVDFGQ